MIHGPSNINAMDSYTNDMNRTSAVSVTCRTVSERSLIQSLIVVSMICRDFPPPVPPELYRVVHII
jgi:hypothetical protein